MLEHKPRRGEINGLVCVCMSVETYAEGVNHHVPTLFGGACMLRFRRYKVANRKLLASRNNTRYPDKPNEMKNDVKMAEYSTRHLFVQEFKFCKHCTGYKKQTFENSINTRKHSCISGYACIRYPTSIANQKADMASS